MYILVGLDGYQLWTSAVQRADLDEYLFAEFLNPSKEVTTK